MAFHSTDISIEVHAFCSYNKHQPPAEIFTALKVSDLQNCETL